MSRGWLFVALVSLRPWFDSCESRLLAVILLLLPRPLWVEWVFLECSLEPKLVTLDTWFEPLGSWCYHDSVESCGFGFGLVNQPERDLGYFGS